MLAHLFADLHFGVRALMDKPGFVLAAICTLALRIVASTLVCSLIDDAYVGNLPHRGANALVATALIVTALAVCWFSADRAARLDPLVALRHT